MLRKDETNLEKKKNVCHTLIDLDSGDSNPDQRTTPPLFQLDSHDEVDKNQSEPTNTNQIPEVNNPITYKDTRTDIENQSKNRTPTKSPFKPKLTGITKQKASSPMNTPPPRKFSDTHTRHNTRPIRTRQPPTLFGERVFTSPVKTSDDRPGEHKSTRVRTPLSTTSTEATTTELESHQIDIVDLTSPLTSSPRQPTIAYLMEGESNQTDYVKPFISLSPVGSPKRVQFKPKVRKTEFHPSGLPSESADAIETGVFNPNLFNTTLIITAKALLGRPVTLDELTKWTA